MTAVPPRLAPSDVRWTATQAAARQVPAQWGELSTTSGGDELLLLKDTRREYWNNRLVAPNRFVYSFPRSSGVPFERALRGVLKRRVHPERPPLRVRLFSTPGSRNEYYGEWVVSELRTQTTRHNVSELHLVRLADQPPEVAASIAGGRRVAAEEGRRPAYRSRNEARHAEELAVYFPPADWSVHHEPETLLDLHQPSVVDGVAQDVTDTTHSYTCDFVVAHRRESRRVCVESKPHESHVTDAALAKGRMLRDRTLARVLVMAGDATAPPRWYDFGPPGASAAEAEAWHADFSTLVL